MRREVLKRSRSNSYMNDRQTSKTGGTGRQWPRVKRRALRIGFALVVTLVGVVLSFWWMDRYVTVLAWPAIGLAQAGINYAWLIIPSLFAGWLYWIGRQTFRQGWLRFSFMTVLLVASYCLLARWFLTGTPSPQPLSDRFAGDGSMQLAYRQAYDAGFRDGMVGMLRSYCFMPEAETLGSYEGAYAGMQVWSRMWGKSLSNHEERLMRGWAGIDGVDLKVSE